jgi:proliferating cell nuclear antigen
MFEAEISDISLLRDSIATISELIDETELHITENGIEMIASDRAVVAVVNFSMSKNAFKTYNYDKETKIGINLLNLLQVLRRAGPNDSLSIKLLYNKLELVISGDSKRRFVLPLIDISKEELPPLDKLEFSASFHVDAEIFNSGIEDAELITDSIVLSMMKDHLIMKADSDSSSTQLELPSGTEELKVIRVNEPVRSRYSIDYLKKILKARKFVSHAVIDLATDYPMRINFHIPDKMQLGFVLAPRVEEG